MLGFFAEGSRPNSLTRQIVQTAHFPNPMGDDREAMVGVGDDPMETVLDAPVYSDSGSSPSPMKRASSLGRRGASGDQNLWQTIGHGMAVVMGCVVRQDLINHIKPVALILLCLKT
jgi:hypothetical protein